MIYYNKKINAQILKSYSGLELEWSGNKKRKTQLIVAGIILQL